MRKKTLIPAIVFLIFAGGLFYLLTSFHIDMFSGKVTYMDELYQKEMTKEASYSLGDVVDGKASLNGEGWAMAIGIIAGIPFLIALMVRWRIVRKEKKRALQNMPHETVS